MLLQMQPEQVSLYWEKLKGMIDETVPAVPGESPDKLNNLLTALLDGSFTCWVSFKENADGKRSDSILLTTTVYDRITDTKSLLLYCIIGFGKVDWSSWLEGIEALRKYGKSKGCSRLVSYADDEGIRKIVEGLGGNTNYYLISIPF